MNFEWQKIKDVPGLTYRAAVPGGWLVLHYFDNGANKSIDFIDDVNHTWVIDGTVPAPVPTPVPTPVPVPIPVPVGKKIYVFDDTINPLFRNFSWAPVKLDNPDAFAGKSSIWVDPDAWGALNFNSEKPYTVADIESITFSVKALTDTNQKVQFSLKNIETDSHTPIALTGLSTAAYKTYNFKLIEDLKMDPGAIFTNFTIQGLIGGDQSPLLVDEIFFTQRVVPLVIAPILDPNAPAAPITKPTNTPGWLYTEGNKIFKSDGYVFAPIGVNMPDTRGCGMCAFAGGDPAEVNRRIDEAADVWGAKIFRLTLESYSDAQIAANHIPYGKSILDDPLYLSDIKQVVAHAKVKGIYIILTLFANSEYVSGMPNNKIMLMLKKLAETFKDEPTVIFSVANEPEGNGDGSQNAARWKVVNDCVEVIRRVEGNGPRHLITVPGLGSWARDLSYYLTHPITSGGGFNIVYATHIYDPTANFNKLLEIPAAKLPCIVEEFGILADASATMTATDVSNLIALAKKLQVPALAWTFSWRCGINLLIDNNSNGGCGKGLALLPSDFGKLMITTMKAQ